MTTQLDPTNTGIDQLREVCSGPVFGLVDDGYDAACAGWNLAWTQRPAVVVQAGSVKDVVESTRHAAAHGLAVAVQSTGHGVTVPADAQSLLIQTAALDDVRVDVGSRTATVGGGAQAGAVLTAAQEHGLAPLLGSALQIGTVGYTLGGGFGWLARKHGLAVDHVQSLQMVLADGRLVTVSAYEEPDLFWALCGAGAGSLGVVVEMTFGLVPVTEVYAGNLFYPVEAARDVFDFYRDWAARAPEALTSAFNITSFPPLELVPEPLRGGNFVIVRGCHAGDLEAGAALIDEWRGWRSPLMDMWGPMSFANCAEISQDPVDPVPAGTSGRWLKVLDHGILECMLDAVVGGEGPSPMLFAEARHAGGAIGRPHPERSFAAREADHSLEFVGLIAVPGAELTLERRFSTAWEQVASQLASQPAYLNFTEGQERVRVARQAFDPSSRERLAAVKRRYDPENLFRYGIPLDMTS